MADMTTIPQETRAQSGEAMILCDVAQQLQIASQADCDAATGLLSDIKARSKALTDARMSLTRPLDAAKKTIMDWFRGPLDALDTAERQVKSKQGAWVREQQEAARKAAEEEQKRLQRNAERRAERAEAKGDLERAEQERMEAELSVVAPAKVDTGVQTRTLWRGQVVDLKALCAAIAAGQAPANLVAAVQGEVNKFATATKGSIAVPGVKFYSETSVVAARGAA